MSKVRVIALSVQKDSELNSSAKADGRIVDDTGLCDGDIARRRGEAYGEKMVRRED